MNQTARNRLLMNMPAGCTSCGGDMHVFFEQDAVPVNSCILVHDRDEARDFPVGDIRLGFCHACGFVRNVAFDPRLTEYSGRYEETQAYSPTFNSFHKRLVEELIERHDVRGKQVVEIGCGKGEFLSMICSLGGNRGLGYDPGFDDTRGIIRDNNDVRVVREFFGPDSGRGDADVVVCKMTLEHIERCLDFVTSVKKALRVGADTLAFFQVPEALRIFRECAFEDVYYEHCSYFTPGSAARLFRSAGFDVVNVDVAYSGQYLTLEARNTNGRSAAALEHEDSVDELAALVSTFSERFEAKKADWRRVVERSSAEGPVVIWGSGSKGVSFLHAMHDAGAIDAAVDINPNRQGAYMLGTGHPIVGPDDLREIRPATVIVMNSIYRDEIAQSLRECGVEAELLTL